MKSNGILYFICRYIAPIMFYRMYNPPLPTHTPLSSDEISSPQDTNINEILITVKKCKFLHIQSILMSH